MTAKSSTDYQTDADTLEQSLILPPEGSCFHCGEVLPKEPFYTVIFERPRAMCCLGCQLASQSIVEANLSQYYLDRREISPTASLPDAINFSALIMRISKSSSSMPKMAVARPNYPSPISNARRALG